MSRRHAVCALAASLSLMLAAGAHASTVSNPSGVVTVGSPAPGEANALTITYAAGSGTTPDGYTVHDANVAVTVGSCSPACTPIDANTVFVPGNAGTAVTLGDGGSSVTIAGQDESAGGSNTVSGGTGNDTIVGGARVNVLHGNGGNDTITGGRAGDTLDGGTGNDTESGGSGADTFTTSSGDGADALNGGSGVDSIDYSGRGAAVTVTEDGQANDGESGEGDNVAGIESVDGTAYADSISLTGSTSGGTILGGRGDDTLSGSDAAETIDGGIGNDTVNGNGGNDVLIGGAGNDTLNGGAGGDTIRPGDGNDTASGGAGNDTFDSTSGSLPSGDGADSFTGGTGEDEVDYSGHDGPVTITEDGVANDGEAGEGDNVAADIEVIDGTPDADTITGSAVDNTIYGEGGADTLSGGDGSDTLVASSGGGQVGSTLNGGAGNDTLMGSSADDVFNGGDGDDKFLVVSGGADVFNGGPGVDSVSYAFASFASGVSITPDGIANDGRDGEGANVMPDVENFTGSSGPDLISGAPGVSNRIDGGGGGDAINVASNPADPDSVLCRSGGGGLGIARVAIFNGENDYNDVVTADARDNVETSGNNACATVNRPKKSGPKLTILSKDVKPTGHAFVVVMRCDSAAPRCKVTAQLATPKGTVLDIATGTIGDGKTGQFVFRTSARQRVQIKHGKGVDLRVSADVSDSSGVATHREKTITLKR